MVNFENIYNGKRVLVTGNTGFKGSWLTEWLLMLGAEVYGISNNKPSNPCHFDLINCEKNITHYYEDVRNFDRINNIIKEIKPDLIFHLAAQPLVKNAYENPHYTFETNYLGTLNILESIRINGNNCKGAVMITSDKSYRNVEWTYGYRENDFIGGEDPYSGSKGAAEMVIYSYYWSYFKDKNKPKISAVRAGNVIGGGDWAKDRIIPDIIKSWSNNQAVEIRNPNSTRPWQHVLEPLSGYLLLGSKILSNRFLHGEDWDSFNFGPNADVNHTVEEVILEMQKVWDGFNHYSVKRSENEDFKESKLLKLNCDKANMILNWKPTLNFEETIKFTSNWYREYLCNKNMAEFTRSQISMYSTLAEKKGILWSTPIQQ